MAAAIEAGEAGAEVILLEHNDRPGKKINATGNGKCNLGNSYLNENCYRGGDSAFVQRIFELCSPGDVRQWFTDRGLYLKEKRGYYYPKSEQSYFRRLSLSCF